MKKSLIALAVLAAAGTASAQSSVTLFGVVDTALSYGNGDNANGGSNHRYSQSSSGYNTSRIGFRGTEDLGGGTKATFWMEAGVNTDSGVGTQSNTNNQSNGVGPANAGSQGLIFNRLMQVRLGNDSWGEIRLGRDYKPQYLIDAQYEPYTNNGVGAAVDFATSIGGDIRKSNQFMYYTPPNLGGFSGYVSYYLGENNSESTVSTVFQHGQPAVTINNKGDGSGWGARLTYDNGPLSIAAAAGRDSYATGGIMKRTFAGSYNFGVAKIMGLIKRDNNDSKLLGAPAVCLDWNCKANGYVLGASIPMGVGEIHAAYSRYKIEVAKAVPITPTSKKFALGYIHNLSKRTALYLNAARVSNSDGANTALNGATTTADGKSTGYDLGIRHSF